MSNRANIRVVSQRAHERASNTVVDTKQRAKVAQALSRFLASTYALYQKSLFYHWNVTGPHFASLHKLFEEHYNDLHMAGDEIAERVRALGHFAPGTLSEFAELSSLEEDRNLPGNANQMISNLLKSHEICSGQARKVLELAEESKDPVTHDMMARRMEFHDKAAWMLRSLQA
jgi:starvation-inducible DNA-binding protein